YFRVSAIDWALVTDCAPMCPTAGLDLQFLGSNPVGGPTPEMLEFLDGVLTVAMGDEDAVVAGRWLRQEVQRSIDDRAYPVQRLEAYARTGTSGPSGSPQPADSAGWWTGELIYNPALSDDSTDTWTMSVIAPRPAAP
ncbi:MAG: hypothetical protein M3295_04420, partial [Chloroflexota bacterium]|nr:hypothetical protein [Chloroflexota bacterium]